jgi:predicted TIM-barrel fold metal-dependent hydrolase
MPILFHIALKKYDGYGLIDDLHLPRLETVLKTFPELVVIGHSQPFWAEISGDLTEESRNDYPRGKVAPGGTIPRLLEQYPNLYGDISAGSGYNALTRDPEFGYAFVETFQDRLFFGTDICTADQDHRHAEYLREAGKEGHISEDAFEKVSWQNANRVLKLGL